MLKCHNTPLPERIPSCDDLPNAKDNTVLKGEKAVGGYRFRAYIDDVCIGITDVLTPNDMVAGMTLKFNPIEKDQL